MGFRVQVRYKSGRHANGVDVSLRFAGQSMNTPSVRTDYQGCAEFSGYQDGVIHIIVDGSFAKVSQYTNGDFAIVEYPD